MLKNNKKTMATSRGNAGSPESVNKIVEGTAFTGEVTSETNIRVDGRIQGKLSTKGRLIVGPTGVIEGEVFCQDADIEGTVSGQVVVGGLLSLKATAKIYGDAKFAKLSVEQGAELSCTCNLKKAGAAAPKNGEKVKQAEKAVA